MPHETIDHHGGASLQRGGLKAMSVPMPRVPYSSREQEAFPQGPVGLGSDAHKILFCRMLLDTFDPYKPAVIDWPPLDTETRDRLVGLPIWDMAVQTEGRARLNVASYAAVTPDPLLRKTIELDAFEEGRHKLVLSNLVAAYGVKLAPEPQYVKRDPEWAFMVTRYSECIDSFFAFGLFESARRTGEIKVLAVWLGLIWERIGIARDMGNGAQDHNFTMTGSKSVGSDVSVGELIDICLAENQRRMSFYDRRLLRPTLVPALARFARRFIRS
jgi:hypothetical protein